MKTLRFIGLLALFSTASAALATTYITLPTDRELVNQSGGIVIGTVEGSYVEPAKNRGGFETIYEIRVERSLKGGLKRDEVVSVASPGGELGRFGSYTPGAAHFENGEKVLLFLLRDDDRWTVTEMALGSWRFGKSLEGERLLVRDLTEVEAFDRGGKPEPLRSEPRFLRFINEVVAGDPALDEYMVKGSELPREPVKRNLRTAADSLADPERYTMMQQCPGGVCSPSDFGVRWPVAAIGSGLNFYKHETSNLSGAVDGGVSVIQSGLASWTNDASSAVTLNYAGTHPNAALNTTPEFFNVADGVNVIQYGAAIGAAAGKADIIFFSNAGDGAGAEYREIIDADIRISSSVINESLGLPSIMTHELGHAIGFRHSNAAPTTPNDQTATCSALTDDCVTNENGAIMMWRVVNAGNGFVLQPWDIRAVGAVYPGASLPAPTGVVATASSGTSVDVAWSAVVGAGTYEVHRSSATDFASFSGTPVCTALHPLLTCTDTTAVANQAYLYKVRAGASGAFSATDFATTVAFTDSILTIGSTSVKAAHFTELRTAANAMRALAKISAFSFTDGILNSSVSVKKGHVDDLRTAINAARTTMGFSAGSYTDTITAGSTMIRAVHINDLRTAVR